MANRNGFASGSRCHIVLIPGFGGFDALGRVEYYSGITRLFQKWRVQHQQIPAVLHYFDNLPTAAVVTRAARLRKYLAKRIARGEILKSDSIVLVGHSTGGLDIRQLICDLSGSANDPVVVDCGMPVSAPEMLDCIDAVVFLSVPHWGTNIAEWVFQRGLLRKTVLANLRGAYAASQVYLADRLEAAVADTAAGLLGADVVLALRDTLTEANADWTGPDPSRISDAQETASDLELYFRQMATNFHVIEDLTPTAHNRVKSPAQFSSAQRVDELALWDNLHIRALSYATVGGRPLTFNASAKSPVPEFNLSNPLDDIAVAAACGASRGTDLAYRLCWRVCAGGPLKWPETAGEVTRRLGPRPPEPLKLWDNDGIVNTVSMLWPRGDTVLIQADHLDIVGHYRLREAQGKTCTFGTQPPRVYESYDTLGSSPKFQPRVFEQVWNGIFQFAAGTDLVSFNRKKSARRAGARAAAATSGA